MKPVEIGDEMLLADTISTLPTPQFEQAFADWLNCGLSYDNLAIFAYFQDSPPLPLLLRSTDPKVHKYINSIYLSGTYLLDPLHDLHVRRVEKGVYRLSEIAPDKFQSSQYFTEYYKYTTTVDEIAILAYPTDGVSIHICISRDKTSGIKFSVRDIKTAQRKAPIAAALAESFWNDLNSAGQYAEIDVTAQLIKSIKQAQGIALSPRQAQVAMLILRGHSSVSIGLKLDISYQTVKVFRKQLYKKCEISSQAELFRMFLPYLGSFASGNEI